MNLQPPPAIPPVAGDGRPRPFWSVMMPAYRPDEKYLRLALESILQQAPGPEQMQIEVVDDCSPGIDVAALVKSIAGERVTVSQTPRNLGLAGCWNTCLERSRGEWVNLLHQDDLVLPGFYQRLQEGIMAKPEVGAAFCRHAFINSDGRQTLVSRLECSQAVVFGNILERLAQNCCVQCASIVVKRSVYEQLGGYSYSLKQALDWEMWLRIARKYPVWYEPEMLACYRLHAGSESGRLTQTGRDLVEVRLMLEQAAENLEPRQGRKILAEAKTSYALSAVSNAERFLYRSSSGSERNLKAGWNQIAGAIRMRPSFTVILAVVGVLLRFFRAGVHRVFGSTQSTAKR